MSLDAITVKLNDVNNASIPPWALLIMESMKAVICELQVVKVLASKINELESFKAVSENISENL